MSLVLSRRSVQPERMDTETLGLEEMGTILESLETINERLGGSRATLWHLKRFSKAWKPGETIRIVDWGTGGADLPRAIVRWARRSGFKVKILGIDNNPVVLAYAQKACLEYPEITLESLDVNKETAPDQPFDYAISSLALHHLSDGAIVNLLIQSDRWARRGIIMNDLKRSARAWAWIWTLSRLFQAPAIVQHDGPLSVRRAFTQQELESYARAAGLSYLRVRTHFGYRFTLAGEKSVGECGGKGVTSETPTSAERRYSPTPLLPYSLTDA